MIRSQLLALACAATTLAAQADDWPEWRGHDRQGVWRETGLTKSLPDGDFEYQWRVPCHLGYAGPAVAGGRVYLFEYEKQSGDITNNPGGRDQLTGTERLRCLDSKTGKQLWKYEYERPYSVSYPSGPRCTPTVDEDRVYLLGAEGDLACLATSDGSLIWKKNFKEAYGAPTPIWGHSAHPLVDGQTLYCMVGGAGSVVVAFDKQTGEEKWTALSTPPNNNECGYCPPTIVEYNGKRRLVAFYPQGVSALARDTGEVLWTVPMESFAGMSIAQPLKIEDRLFVTGYGENNSVLLRLPEEGAEPEVIWSGKPKQSFSAANVTPALDAKADVVYGVDASDSLLTAIDLENGERIWETKKPVLAPDAGRRARHGTVFPVRQADTDRFWLASESGDLILAQLTPEGYVELGRKPLIKPTGESFGRPVWWSHPAYAERSVFARNDEEIVRVNLAAE